MSTQRRILKRGDVWREQFQFRVDGVPLDLTGCGAALQLRKSANAEAVLNASTETGELTVNELEGDVVLEVGSSIMAAIPVSDYLCDLQIAWPDGEVTSTATFAVRVESDITRGSA